MSLTRDLALVAGGASTLAGATVLLNAGGEWLASIDATFADAAYQLARAAVLVLVVVLLVVWIVWGGSDDWTAPPPAEPAAQPRHVLEVPGDVDVDELKRRWLATIERNPVPQILTEDVAA